VLTRATRTQALGSILKRTQTQAQVPFFFSCVALTKLLLAPSVTWQELQEPKLGLESFLDPRPNLGVFFLPLLIYFKNSNQKMEFVEANHGSNNLEGKTHSSMFCTSLCYSFVLFACFHDTLFFFPSPTCNVECRVLLQP